MMNNFSTLNGNEKSRLQNSASSALHEESSIIGRREIEPLLDKACEVLAYYDTAMNCSAMVLDRYGAAVQTPEYFYPMKLCELCRRCCQSVSKESGRTAKKNKYPYVKMHHTAQQKSRRMDGTYIYSCDMGFIYWTSPLYRNGRYAGACTAGQILPVRDEGLRDTDGSLDTRLSNGHKTVMDKFSGFCKEKNTVQQFNKALLEVPEKSAEEIQAMARFLGICAGEISEKGEMSGTVIRRLAWIKKDSEFTAEKINTDAVSPDTTNRCIPGKIHSKGKFPLPDTGEGARFNAAGHYMEKERMLLAALRRGDNETGNLLLNELMAGALYTVPCNLDLIRFRAIELAVLLSRAGANKETGSDAMLETNNRYMKRIQDSKTTEELMENLHLAAERMAGNIFSFTGIRHASVLRRAERFIWDNYTRKISLEEIARASGLSAPYFSTIFKEEMGENLSAYLNRLRVERAAALLTETGRSLNEIASLCGFEDQSWFSKIFKSYTGVSPSKYRKAGHPARGFALHRDFPNGEIRE
ncbi:MAG: helix-turn-helix domain-containing protein [Treponema sp.]|nr:helix-turn-helix domain-containing protein [Treponema sp.]